MSRRPLDAAQANVSLNQTVGGDNDGELGDLFADQTSAGPVRRGRGLVPAKAVAKLPEREARIVTLRFGPDGEPQSLEAIGKEVGLTRERVRQLETQAFARLQNELAGIADELQTRRRRTNGAGPFAASPSPVDSCGQVRYAMRMRVAARADGLPHAVADPRRALRHGRTRRPCRRTPGLGRKRREHQGRKRTRYLPNSSSR